MTCRSTVVNFFGVVSASVVLLWWIRWWRQYQIDKQLLRRIEEGDGDIALSLVELTRIFPGLLSADKLRQHADQWDRLPIYQEVPEELRMTETPAVIVFVSHVWETPDHPDPDHRQLDAMKKLLDMIVEESKLWYLLFCEPHKFSSTIATNKTNFLLEGVPQAHYILSSVYHACLLSKNFNLDSVTAEQVETISSLAPDQILSRIAVFYDFMSLPQQVKSRGIFRTSKEEAVFRQSLRHMSDLATESVVCSLRHSGDTYVSRAWCTMEREAGWEERGGENRRVSPKASERRKSLRVSVDRLGCDETLDLTHAEKVGARIAVEFDTIEKIRAAIASFQEAPHAVYALLALMDFSENFVTNQQLCDSMEQFAAFQEAVTSPVTADLFFASDALAPSKSVHSTLSLQLVGIFMNTFLFEMLWSPEHDGRRSFKVNLGAGLSRMLRYFGLNCTAGSDLAYVALSAFSTHHCIFLKFYCECLDAWLDHKYRSKNNKHHRDEDFWVVFHPSELELVSLEEIWWFSQIRVNPGSWVGLYAKGNSRCVHFLWRMGNSIRYTFHHEEDDVSCQDSQGTEK